MPSWFTIARPTSPSPMTRLNTPAGAPASIRICAERVSDRRRRGGRLQDDRIAEGEGRRGLPCRDRDREVPWRDQAEHADRFAVGLDVDRGRVNSSVCPCRRSASPAKYLRIRAARMTSPVPSGRVLPSSRDSKVPSSLARLMISEPALSSTSERTSGEASDQAGNAARAAFTASVDLARRQPFG